jgi:hypothetical protein
MKEILYRSRAALMKALSLLAFLAGITLGWEVHAACRQVCTTQSNCEGLSGEERWSLFVP